MHKCRWVEKGQGVGVAEGKVMSLIEIRWAAVGAYVVAVHERVVEAIRGIINRMAVGVCKANLQITNGSPCTDLQGVIAGIPSIVEPDNVAVPEEVGSQRIRISPACHRQIRRGFARDGWSARPPGEGGTVARVNGVPGGIQDWRSNRRFGRDV